MRKTYNIKANRGQVFTRQVPELAPECQCFVAPPRVVHVTTKRKALASVEHHQEMVECFGAHGVPVFHFTRREPCLDFCLPGVLGELIHS